MFNRFKKKVPAKSDILHHPNYTKINKTLFTKEEADSLESDFKVIFIKN